MLRSDLPVELVAAAGEVHRYLQLALAKGKGSGIPALIERLHALGVPTPTNWIAVEAQTWCACIDEHLDPEVRDIVLEVLRGDPNGKWLDATARCESDAAALDQVATGVGEVGTMLVRHLASGALGHLRDALSALESLTQAYRAAVTDAPGANECLYVSQLLGQALDAGLQPPAVAFFVADVRERVHGATGQRSRLDRRREDDQWLSRATWIEYDPEEVIETGAAFTGHLQARYETVVEEIQRSRRAEASRREKENANRAAWEARRKAEAAGADPPATTSPDEPDRTRDADAILRDALEADVRRRIPLSRLQHPESLATMSVDELREVQWCVDWDTRHDADDAQRERDKEEYGLQLIERAYC